MTLSCSLGKIPEQHLRTTLIWRLETCILVALGFMSSFTLYVVHHVLKQVQGFVTSQFVSFFAYRATWVMWSDVQSWLLEKCVMCIGIQLVTACWNIAPWCCGLHKPDFKGENGPAALLKSTALVLVLLLGYKGLIKGPFHSRQTNCTPSFLRHCLSSNNESARSSTMFPPPLLQRRLLADVIRSWRVLLTVRPRVLAAELLNSGATTLIMCFPPLTRSEWHSTRLTPCPPTRPLASRCWFVFALPPPSTPESPHWLVCWRFPATQSSSFVELQKRQKFEYSSFPISLPSGDDWKRQRVWTGASQDKSCGLYWGRHVYCGYLSIRGC